MDGPRLSLEQRQKLVLSPQLRQALAVLQLPLTSLSQLVQQELWENPLLEVREEPEPRADEKPEEPDWVELFGDCSDLGYVSGEAREFRDDPTVNVGAPAGSLFDYLLFQLHVSGAPAHLQVVGEYLLGCLDSRGYLAVPTEEIAAILRCPLADVREALTVVQSLDPPGIGARSIQECLLLQLDRLPSAGHDEVVALARRLVEGHLDDLASGRLERVAQSLGVDAGQAQAALDVIRSLEPKPGAAFGDLQDVRYVQPDIVVERVGSEYVVLVNDWGVPRLGVSRFYRRILQAPGADETTRAYLQEKMRRAVWFLRSIEQRRHTLHRVAEAVFTFQRGFLDYGWPGLRPLTLREVADAAGCHESTVSRAVAGKYAQTPRGVFAMRFFFPSALAGRYGETVAASSAKRLLQEIVGGEDVRAPYSDEELVREMAARGVRLSRRTVAKYRAELGIAASSRRRRY